jgi:predicted oxidoreductase
MQRICLHPAEGPECSRIALGLWRLTEWDPGAAALAEFLDRCLDLGVTTFDHADIYGDYAAESLFGAAIARNPGLRNRMEVVSKCGIRLGSARGLGATIKHYDTGRAHIRASVERSLANLHTDHLDLLLLHRPDPFMDPDETAEALAEMVREGKVKHCGVSNFAPSQFDLLASRLDIPLVTNQIEASVLHQSPFTDGTLDHCQRLRIAPMAWSPLAGGRIFDPADSVGARVRPVLEQIGRELEAPADQVALAWLAVHPARFVIVVGTGRFERVVGAVRALELKLTREQWFRIHTAAIGRNVA